MTKIGIKNGMAFYVSDALLAQHGLHKIMEKLGMTKCYPVKTDLGGATVMVEGDSHEDAIKRYLTRNKKGKHDAR